MPPRLTFTRHNILHRIFHKKVFELTMENEEQTIVVWTDTTAK